MQDIKGQVVHFHFFSIKETNKERKALRPKWSTRREVVVRLPYEAHLLTFGLPKAPGRVMIRIKETVEKGVKCAQVNKYKGG